MSAAVYANVLRHAWWHRRSQGALWVFQLAMFVLVATVPAVTVFGVEPHRAQVVAAITLYMIVSMAWQALLNAVMVLNTPANARVVPFGSRPSRSVVKLVGLLLCLAGGVVTGAMFDMALAGMVVTGLLLAGGGLLGAARWEGLLVYGAAMFIGFFVSKESGTAMADAVVLAGMVLLPLAGMGMMARLFPASADGHWRDSARAERRMALVACKVEATPASVPDWINRYYLACLGRAAARRDTSALLAHVLGPRAHWVTLLAGAALYVVTVLLMAALVRVVPIAGATREVILGFLCGVQTSSPVFVLVSAVLMIQVRLASTTVEQGLLRLTPGMAQGTALNRMLACRLFKQGMWTALACLAWVVAGNLACGATLDSAIVRASTMSPLLLFVPLVLRAPATMGNPLHVGALALTTIAAFGLAGAFAMLNMSGFGLPWPLLVPVSAGIAAVLCRWRWNTLVNGPVALPAGRLAV